MDAIRTRRVAAAHRRAGRPRREPAIPLGDDYVVTVSLAGAPEHHGPIGGIAANERIEADTVVSLTFECNLTWWTVTRPDPTLRYVRPLPATPKLWLCL